MTETCLTCTKPLLVIDADPNGDLPAHCVKCQAEEKHDFDADPYAVFNRSGERVELSAHARGTLHRLEKVRAARQSFNELVAALDQMGGLPKRFKTQLVGLGEYLHKDIVQLQEQFKKATT